MKYALTLCLLLSACAREPIDWSRIDGYGVTMREQEQDSVVREVRK